MEKNLPPMYKHQKEIVEMSLLQDEIALFHGLGSGKTRSVIESLRAIFNLQRRTYKVLILGVPAVIYNWKNEIIKFSNIPEKSIYVCASGTNRDKKLKKAIDSGAQIITINYEALLSEKIFQVLQEWRPQILVCDEVHQCKNPSAKRSKKVFELSKGTFKRFILTGTPILRNMMDIFMQFKILDGGKTFGHNYFSFRAKYFVDKNAAWSGRPNHFPEWIPRADTQEELMRKIKQRAHVVETKDCIDLPPYIDTIEHVEMGKNQKIAYEQMRDYLMTFLEENMDKPAVATIAPVKALRLLQIVSGHVAQDDGKIVTFENPKLERLMELLEDIVPENKVIIWTEFKHDISAISTELKAKGYSFVTVSGEQTTQEKQKAVDDFQNDPSVHIFLGNSSAGGTGINLTRAKYSIRYSRSFNLGNFLQSTARNYRGGSQEHDSIININISMKDTIDEKVALALMSKEEIGKNMVNFIKENA